MKDLNNETLKLDYPCSWIYKLVVLEHIKINGVVIDVLGQREFKVGESKKSSKGKFKSYTLDIFVHNEDDRKGLYELLGNHSDIKMII